MRWRSAEGTLFGRRKQSTSVGSDTTDAALSPKVGWREGGREVHLLAARSYVPRRQSVGRADVTLFLSKSVFRCEAHLEFTLNYDYINK